MVKVRYKQQQSLQSIAIQPTNRSIDQNTKLITKPRQTLSKRLVGTYRGRATSSPWSKDENKVKSKAKCRNLLLKVIEMEFMNGITRALYNC
jgi:hypothetical protein